MFHFIYSHFILISLFFIALTVSIFYEFWIFFYKDIKYINPEEIVSLLNNNNAIIFDFRDKASFLYQHILTSLNIDVNNTDFPFLKKKYSHKKIIIVGDYRISNRKLVKTLHCEGFWNIYFLKNGLLNWSRSGFFLFTKKINNLKKINIF